MQKNLVDRIVAFFIGAGAIWISLALYYNNMDGVEGGILTIGVSVIFWAIIS